MSTVNIDGKKARALTVSEMDSLKLIAEYSTGELIVCVWKILLGLDSLEDHDGMIDPSAWAIPRHQTQEILDSVPEVERRTQMFQWLNSGPSSVTSLTPEKGTVA